MIMGTRALRDFRLYIFQPLISIQFKLNQLIFTFSKTVSKELEYITLSQLMIELKVPLHSKCVGLCAHMKSELKTCTSEHDL